MVKTKRPSSSTEEEESSSTKQIETTNEESAEKKLKANDGEPVRKAKKPKNENEDKKMPVKQRQPRKKRESLRSVRSLEVSIDWHESLRYGFAKFSSHKDARKAIKRRCVRVIGEEELQIQPLGSKSESKVKDKEGIENDEVVFVAGSVKRLILIILRKQYEGLMFITWNPLSMHGAAGFKDEIRARKAVAKGKIDVHGCPVEVTADMCDALITIQNGHHMLLKIMQEHYEGLKSLKWAEVSHLGFATFNTAAKADEAIAKGKISVFGNKVEVERQRGFNPDEYKKKAERMEVKKGRKAFLKKMSAKNASKETKEENANNQQQQQ